MKLNPACLFLCCLITLTSWGMGGNSFLSAAAKEAPHIVFEDDSHDFGDLYKGEKASHRFTFSNEGSDDLVIQNVKTSCGCTAAALSQSSIPPGTKAEIEVTLSTNAFRGNVSKTVTVSSNDPEKPHYVLTIEANVLEEVVAEPRHVWFDPVKLGQSATREVDIKPVTDLKLKITKVRATSSLLKLRYKKKDDENGYRVTVSTKKDAPLGRFAGDIQVFTNSKRQSVVVIPFSGEIISDVSVFPAKVSYGVVHKGEEAVRQILITVYKKDVKLKKFDVKPDYLSLHLIPDSNNYLHRLEITLGKDVPVGRFEGNVTIHTTSNDQPLLTIPIYGVVREG